MRLSYSKWSLYHQCPFKYKCKYILNLKEPPAGAAVSRGSLIHDMIEQYVLGASDQLPWEATNTLKVPAMGKQHPLQSVVDKLRDWPSPEMFAEKAVELGVDMEPFPQGEAAYIVIFDAVAVHNSVVEVAEWKSGKPYAEHTEQRHLYATAALNIWMPKEVLVSTYYVDCTSTPEVTKATQDDAKAMRIVWQSRRETMMNDQILAPRPNSKCKRCHFRKENNGPCPM